MSLSNSELNHFRTRFLQDINDAIHADNAGGIREEKFTQFVLDYLDEAGETEGAVPCREIRENSIGSRIHKINGYALSEGYETVDLFITIFKGSSEIGRLYSEELKTAVNLSTRFLQNLLAGKMEGIEETAPVFDFVNTIIKIYKDIVRVNIYILSDVLMPLDPPEQTTIGDIGVYYYLKDIEYLHRIHVSGAGKQSILINFVKIFNESVPCLSMPDKNEEYESYLAIIPARMLADIYKEYGARLLEQNVRTFLQFRGNINKGIRDTILREPHMFMAYNNGISATAESVELAPDRKAIVSVNDFQIVNGGQTTASIFQTRRRHKTADINAVFVQVKLTVIKDPLRKSEIVSRISRFANTQNKVSEADLSSNHGFHIEIERLSRKTWTPINSEKNQTRWFYERARGQYNDELSQIESLGKQKKWLSRNPKSQMFAKEDLARFYMAWEMGPWWVVKGRQRNFVEFMKIADNLDSEHTFFEQLVAKAIIFRAAEKLYGAGPKSLGDLRYMVVPYSLSWLRFATDNKINLLKIWQQQSLSSTLEGMLLEILKKVDHFMRQTAPGGLIGEWAKKEECWNLLRSTGVDVDISTVVSEFYSVDEIRERYRNENLNLDQRILIKNLVEKVGVEGWIKIEQFGKSTGAFDILQLNFLWKIIRKLETNKLLTDLDLIRIESILISLRSYNLSHELLELISDNTTN